MFLLLKGELGGIYSPFFYLTLPKNIKYGKKLKEIANINPTRNKPKFNADILVPYVGLPETDEYDNDVKVVLERPFVEVGGRNIIRKDDILFARIEPSVFNKKYIYVDDLKGFDFAFTSTEFYILESKTVLQKYLFYILFLDFVYNQVEGKTTGSTGRRRLDKGAFENIIIPSPPLETQQTIINIFENAYAKKKAKEAEAKLLLDSIDGYLLEELGITLPEKQENTLKNRVFLRSICEVSGGRLDGFYYQNEFIELNKALSKTNFVALKKLTNITDGSHLSPPNDSSQSKRYVTVRDINSFDEIDFENCSRINEQDFEALVKSGCQPQKNDVLFSKDGTIGKVHVVKEDSDFVVLSSLAIITPDINLVNPEYLGIVLKANFTIQLVKRLMGGTAIQRIILANLRELKIPLPSFDIKESLEIQEKIVAEISHRRKQAKDLQTEAKALLEKAKIEVERMILGGGSDD